MPHFRLTGRRLRRSLEFVVIRNVVIVACLVPPSCFVWRANVSAATFARPARSTLLHDAGVAASALEPDRARRGIGHPRVFRLKPAKRDRPGAGWPSAESVPRRAAYGSGHGNCALRRRDAHELDESALPIGRHQWVSSVEAFGGM